MGLGGFLDNAVNTVTGKKQADMAAKEQDRRMKQALGEYNVYSSGGYYDDEDVVNGVETRGVGGRWTTANGLNYSGKQRNGKLKSFDDMQRSIIDEQASGKAASVSGYDRTTASPMRALYNAGISGAMNKAMGGSLGGTAARGTGRTISQGITNADNAMYSRAQDMAGQMKQSALANLQAAAAGRANVQQGMANQVQAGPSPLQMFNSAMNTYKNMAGATARSGK